MTQPFFIFVRLFDPSTVHVFQEGASADRGFSIRLTLTRAAEAMRVVDETSAVDRNTLAVLQPDTQTVRLELGGQMIETFSFQQPVRALAFGGDETSGLALSDVLPAYEAAIDAPGAVGDLIPATPLDRVPPGLLPQLVRDPFVT